jgi:flagellar motor switch protein FliN/FliY
MSDKNPGSGFLGLELKAEVWMATEELPLARLLELERGKTLALTRDPDAAVDLVINGSVVASGELVVVDGHFGFRVTRTSQQMLAGLPGTGRATREESRS